MNDLYEAVERLSAELSFVIGRLAAERGWSHKTYPWMITNGPRFFLLTSTTVNFPGGPHGSFTPSPEPEGSRWHIDIRRTDGVARADWQPGTLYLEQTPSAFQLIVSGAVLTDESMRPLLESLATL